MSHSQAKDRDCEPQEGEAIQKIPESSSSLDCFVESKDSSRNDDISKVWSRFEDIKDHNQVKVLDAFKKAGVQNSHFSWVTGYGYDDLGKDKLDEVYACYFNVEAALVRPQLVSGTHAISCAVFGNLDAEDSMLAIGDPYDTLNTVFRNYTKKYKINYEVLNGFQPRSLDHLNDDDLILELSKKMNTQTKLVFIQRSRGYEWRDSYSLSEIERLIKAVKTINKDCICFVDNCYGEFTQKQEPTDIGADIIAGSLIKNPGGSIVASGAYIAGKQEFVNKAADALTAPGIGAHGGCMFDQTRLMFQGFFMAPMIVFEALKGMSLAAKLFAEKGLETIPSFDADRNDIIQASKFGSRESLVNFCKLVQENSPLNSMFSPVPDSISGYDDEIIMASGSFIEGSSIELSADGPLREPYIGYLQGGISYSHTKYVLEEILEQL